MVGLGALGAGLPESLAVLLAACLAGVTRVAGITMTTLEVEWWIACTMGLLLLLLFVVGGGTSKGVGVGEGGRDCLQCSNVVDYVHQVPQLAVLGSGEHPRPGRGDSGGHRERRRHAEDLVIILL